MLFFPQDSIDRCFIDKETELNNKVGLFYLLHHFLIQYERYEDNWGFMLLKVSGTNTNKKAIARILKAHSRRSDILFNLEGDFGVLTRVFSDTDLIYFSQRLFSIFKEKIPHIDVRYGITFMKNGDSPESLTQRAFKAAEKAYSEDTPYAIVV